MVAARIDAAGRSGDRRGRYKLARVVDAWCEQTGQSIASRSEQEPLRHRSLTAALAELEAKPSVAGDGIDEIKLHVLEDDIDRG